MAMEPVWILSGISRVPKGLYVPMESLPESTKVYVSTLVFLYLTEKLPLGPHFLNFTTMVLNLLNVETL